MFASELSPPGSMKDNGAFQTGGNMIGNSTNYNNLANIQVAFVTLMKGTYSVPIYAISPQNEPEVSTHYPSCVWTSDATARLYSLPTFSPQHGRLFQRKDHGC